MKVKFLTPLATASDSFEQDEVREVADIQAKHLISAGIAEPIQQTPETRRPAGRRHTPPAATAF